MKEEPKLKDIISGLIVVDPESYDEETNTVEIVHFCGYWDEVTQDDVDALRRELAEDDEFGVTDIVDRLEIIECPEEMLDYYRNQDTNE